jgi:hypothetical protein
VEIAVKAPGGEPCPVDVDAETAVPRPAAHEDRAAARRGRAAHVGVRRVPHAVRFEHARELPDGADFLAGRQKVSAAYGKRAKSNTWAWQSIHSSSSSSAGMAVKLVGARREVSGRFPAPPGTGGAEGPFHLIERQVLHCNAYQQAF